MLGKLTNRFKDKVAGIIISFGVVEAQKLVEMFLALERYEEANYITIMIEAKLKLEIQDQLKDVV